MSYILAAFFVLALVCGGISGRMAEVSAAAMEGAGAAVELCLSMAGAICLWSGVMTLMAQGCGGVASDELCRLVVLNTASIQLLPTTVAAVRSAHGCAAPLDILPSVWLSSLLSVTAGLLAARGLQALWRRKWS